jgi:hypothetical protein
MRLVEAGAPHLLVLTIPVGEAREERELAAVLRARHGTACVFILEQIDENALGAAGALGVDAVLCKPMHREQLEATFRFALDRYDRERRVSPDGRNRPAGSDIPAEDALRQIADLLVRAGVPADRPPAL